jgi:hypothetical protein
MVVAWMLYPQSKSQLTNNIPETPADVVTSPARFPAQQFDRVFAVMSKLFAEFIEHLRTARFEP